jgi:hypothetical protein
MGETPEPWSSLSGGFFLAAQVCHCDEISTPQCRSPDLGFGLSSSLLGMLDTQPHPHCSPGPQLSRGSFVCPRAMSFMEELGFSFAIAVAVVAGPEAYRSDV